MACKSTPSTSQMKRKATVNAPGITEMEYNELLGLLESDEEPYCDSGSEYAPNESDLDTSDDDIAGTLVALKDEEAEMIDIIQQDNLQHDKAESEVCFSLPTDFSIAWENKNFVPKVHEFDDGISGICPTLDNIVNEVDYFLELFTPEVVQVVAEETNRYAAQVLHKNKENKKCEWQKVTVDEFYVFIALMLLSTCNKKRILKQNWSTDPLLYSPIFGRTMARDRFMNILSMLHFANNNEQQHGDSLHKLRGVLNKIKRGFSEKFYPFKNLVVDESLVLFKGRLMFKQFIRTKRHRFGIKLFVLCDCETGYVLDFIIYTGKQTEIKQFLDLGISGSIVATLIKPYLNKGHSLYTDNWYTSPSLSTYLYQQGTNSCGTVRLNRKHMPNLSKKLSRGETVSMASANLLAIKWNDRRDVTMLTTMHEDKMITLDKVDRKTNQPVCKPECVVSYNENMGAVDRSDMMLSSTECVRKTVKWYKKIFFHAVDLCLLNAHALYLMRNPQKVDLSSFQLKIIRQLLEKYATSRPSSKGGRPRSVHHPLRLIERHFPAPVPPTEKRKTAVRRCIVCSQTTLGKRKRKESRIMCKECDVGLCTYPCFGIYHTKNLF